MVLSARRLSRELSSSFTPPYFREAHWQTHAVRQALRYFPYVQRRWQLPAPPPLVVPFTAQEFHPVESCPRYRVGALRDASLDQVESILCPHCAVLLGSSYHLSTLTDSAEGAVVSPLVYATFASLLFAHSHPSFQSGPEALGWVVMSALDAASRTPVLAGLLAPVLEQVAPRRAELTSEALAMVSTPTERRTTLVADIAWKTGALLGVSPESVLVGGSVVLRSAPFGNLHPRCIAVGDLSEAEFDVFVGLFGTGLSPLEAAAAASALAH